MMKEYNESIWNNIIVKLNFILKEFSKDSNGKNSLNTVTSMYIDKTEKYYKDLIDKFEYFNLIKNHEYLFINDKQYENFYVIWPIIKNIIKHKLLDSESKIIHGDFCFSNILYGTNPKSDITILRLVDPRGSFGNIGIYGDPRYDIAKLRHSYEGGYEYIIYDKFNLSLSEKSNEIKFNFEKDNRDEIQKLFSKFPEFNTLETKLIEGLIFIGMCSRHYDSLKRQIVMYCTGIKLLNEVLESLES